MESERPPRAVLHSLRLTGLRGECPACGEREMSTGWLLYEDDGKSCWYLDLICTGCGSRGSTWKREWLPLISEVLEANAKDGLDLAAMRAVHSEDET